MTRQYKEYTILSAKGATGIGIPVLAEDFKHCIFSFATDGGADAALTVKFQGAISDGATTDQPPTFSSAASVTNHWDYIELIDLENGSAIDGDTGVAVATADDYRLLEANINGLRWLNAVVTARTAGEVTIKVKLYNNS